MSLETKTPDVRISRLEDSLASVVEAGHGAIDARLRHLEGEWSMGRMVKATAGVLILGGLGLTIFVNPWLAVIPAAGGLMLAQNLYSRKSLLGEMFAAMGFRTSVEIDHERMALKAIRGDFRDLPTIHQIEDRDAISRFEDEGGPVFEHEQPRVDPREAAREIVAATKR
jgi:hypothetical protein